MTPAAVCPAKPTTPPTRLATHSLYTPPDCGHAWRVPQAACRVQLGQED